MADQWSHDEHPARGQTREAGSDEDGDTLEPCCESRSSRGQHGHDQAGSSAAQVPGEGPAGDGPQNHRRTDDADERQGASAGARNPDGESPFEGPQEQAYRPCAQAEANRGRWRAARRMRVHGPVTVYVMGGIVCRCLFRCGIS